MVAIKRWPGLLAGLLLAVALAQSRATQADSITFTVTAASAFLRAQPAFDAPRMYSVFAGQSYGVAGRNELATWLLLDFPGAAAGTAWIPASYGTVSGNLGLAPVMNAPPLPAPTTTAVIAPAQSGPAGPVYYTVAVRSMFGRQGPAINTARLVSLFQGQRYAVAARSADGQWLRLSVPGLGEAWVAAANGTVTGNVLALPVAGAAAATQPTAPSAPPPASAPLPSVSQAARDIYQRGLSLGNRANAFSKIGDCNSVSPYFLAPFDRGEYRLGQYAYLQSVINQFAGSFGRDGAAAMDGMNVTSVFDPIWANPNVCQRGESPLACELRLHRPSLAIVSLGTNGYWHTDQEYEHYTRRILDELIAQGVLPILSTKADNLETGDRFNGIIRRLAGEYNLPLWDFAATAQALPNGGLADAYHLTWGQAYYDTAPQPYTGWQARNLTALQALEAVWRGAQ